MNHIAIEVNPRAIDMVATFPHRRTLWWSRRILRDRLTERLVRPRLTDPRSFVWPGRWDRYLTPFRATDRYRHVSHLWQHRDNFTRSHWYQKGLSAIRERGEWRHKDRRIASLRDLDAFFQGYALGLLLSMRDGYDATRRQDPPNAAITRDGRLVKADSGMHRFAAAQVVGLDRFPLMVRAVHAEWLETVRDGDIAGAVQRVAERYGAPQTASHARL